jgi:hypothetical protein
VLDALMFEERGIPGIAVVTVPFRATAAAMAATWGLPAFPFLAVPHPIATLSPAGLDAVAERLAAEVAALLTAG